MKIFIILLGLYFSINPSMVHAQPITGNWHGILNAGTVKLPLVLHIQHSGNALSSTLDSPAQGANGINVDETNFVDSVLTFNIKQINASYKGKFVADSIIGTFTQMGRDMPLTFKKGESKPLLRPQTPKPPFNYNIAEVSFINPLQQNTLAGTLTTPMDKTNFPVIVMITGSGAQDRDETLFEHKPFWVIADYFAKKGIGVLRLDDRGVGESSAGKKDPSSADFTTDIEAAVNYLRKLGYKKIGLLGHSEGGMIAPIVAAHNKHVKFLISLAGPGIKIDSLYKLQIGAVVKSSGGTEEDAVEAVEQTGKIIDAINQYKGDVLKAELRATILAGIKDSTMAKQMGATVDASVKTYSSNWFTYFLQFDPAVYIQKLKIPVLALNGSLDVQVTPKENLAGWRTLLQKAKNKKFTIIEVPGANHLFQQAKTGSVGEYGTIEQTFDPKVLDTMANWILGLK
ncbi:MAG: alpha/beta hydrolase family protein [Niabella sp.]